MNISDDYIPVLLDTIWVDTIVGCDLYLPNCAQGEIKYILYCNGTKTISSEKINELQNHKIERLFIHKEDQDKYLKYVESCFKNIINDSKINISDKAQLVYHVAKNIMMDIFADPRSGKQVKRAKNWVGTTIDMIVNNKSATGAMINILSFDYYTYTHSVNVAVLGLLFSRYLGLKYDELHLLGTGLLLHDIGKTQIESEIINKKGKLNEKEYMRVKMHVELGANILTQVDGFDGVSLLPLRQHHEKCNGKGYPGGLKSDDIHKFGKIASILDVYDALTTRRPYADARKPFSALKIMKDEMEGSFDSKLFTDFILFLSQQSEK
ncbi:MAG: HD domain-containing protein [Planctomycetia bacterium]|nr:HD domain-containing protein [Planctomycetia bacterium]